MNQDKVNFFSLGFVTAMVVVLLFVMLSPKDDRQIFVSYTMRKGTRQYGGGGWHDSVTRLSPSGDTIKFKAELSHRNP